MRIATNHVTLVLVWFHKFDILFTSIFTNLQKFILKCFKHNLRLIFCIFKHMTHKIRSQ